MGDHAWLRNVMFTIIITITVIFSLVFVSWCIPALGQSKIPFGEGVEKAGTVSPRKARLVVGLVGG